MERRTGDTATLSGSLETFTVGQILPLLAASGTTGTLRVWTDGDEGRVHLHDGTVTFASVGPDEGLVTVADGAVVSDRMHRLLVRHVEEVTFELDRWATGHLHVEPTPPHPLSAHLAVPVDGLLAAVDERRSRWPQLIGRVRSEHRIVHASPISVDDDAELRVSRAQLAVLAGVDGTRSISELARVLGTGLYRTCDVVAALVDAELVVLGA